ncbi:MAG: aromatic ring-hydroxylating dioxygenase subunit alpha [Dehalococcoidia bacterium]
MLTREENDLLGRVGPGTPMGELMRRYWQPVAAVAELDDHPTKPVRLMGEDLVLYKDKSGTYGLLERHCAHRRADLSYGWVEEHGIRCNYHGWMYDETGQCTEQPFEQTAHPDGRFAEKVTTRSYHVQAKAGLLWAYMGDAPAPELWDWDRYYDRGYKQIVFSTIPCNWLQCQENSIDPVHFEWIHSNWSLQLAGKDETSPAHVKVGFDEFEHGFSYRRVREDTTEDDELWTVGRVCLWPNALYTGHFEWRVPIDDENTLSVGWFLDLIPGDAPFEQERVPYWYAPIKDEATGRWITSHIMNQDFVGWVGQGAISDRWNEHLGESDRGVIMVRKRFQDDLRTIADGGDPKSIIRDTGRNRMLHLPIIGQGNIRPPRAEPHPFPFLAGQPQEIIDDMRAVWAEHV